MPKVFKCLLKPALITKAFYILDELMTHYWEI